MVPLVERSEWSSLCRSLRGGIVLRDKQKSSTPPPSHPYPSRYPLLLHAEHFPCLVTRVCTR